MQQEVGIRLKVAAQGLDLIKGLIRDLDAAGVNTDELKQSANALGASLDKIGPKYGAAATSAGTASSAMVRSQREVGDGLEQLSNQLRLVQSAFLALTGGSALGGMVKDVAKTADEYAGLSGRIRLAVGDGKALQDALAGVLEVATATRSDLEATGTLFTKVLEAGKALGIGRDQALALTKTINQAVQITGGSAESAKAAIVQLTQGLQSGVLRGDEFNSVMEQAPRLATALADALGVTKGKLREMAEAGSLSAEKVITALQLQARTLETEFASLPPTVSGAVQNLTNAWTVYIGQADKASGASSKAAEAINYLAQNLRPIADRLADLAQGAAAFIALRLAQNFLGVGEAAKAAATGVASAASQMGAAAEGAKTAATAGQKLAGALASLKTFALLTLVTNLKDIGTSIGEGTAKLFGYGKALDDLEIKQRADAAAAKAAAAERAEYALKTRLAAESALGLTDASRKIVADFDEMRKKGDSVGESLEKIAKGLDLGSMPGIRDAVTGLDVLAKQGKITADQIRETLAAALSGQDLAKFEVQARAAFDGSEQGARRLKAALDAITDEALKRAGTSVGELKTGFSAAMIGAMNDTDALVKSLDQLGAAANEAGTLVAASLDKEVNAAKTERALVEVRKRLEELGRQGLISSEQLAAGLDKVAKKIDDLKPGINSLEEALREFGLKSQAELRATAERMAQAWDRIRASTQVSLADQIEAFKKYRDTAIAANGGIESSQVAVQRAMLETKAEVGGLGEDFARAMEAGSKATRKLVGDIASVQTQVASLSSSLDALASKRPESVLGPSGQSYSIGSSNDPHASGPTNTIRNDQYPYASTSDRWSTGASSTPSGQMIGGPSGLARIVTINIGSSSANVAVASDADAAALERILRQLETSARVAQPGG